MIRIRIAEAFTRHPGGRYRSDGPWSAEQFLEEVLEPTWLKARAGGQGLVVDLDGSLGYSTGFLEESFGGLARKYGSSKVLGSVQIESTEEPYLKNEVEGYIKWANGEKDVK